MLLALRVPGWPPWDVSSYTNKAGSKLPLAQDLGFAVISPEQQQEKHGWNREAEAFSKQRPANPLGWAATLGTHLPWRGKKSSPTTPK